MAKLRIISGCLIGAAVVLFANFMPAWGCLAILIVISVIAQYEFYALMTKAGMPVFRLIGTLCGVLLIATTFITAGPEQERLIRAHYWENMVFIITLILIFVRQFPQKHNDKPLQTLACTLMGILYVPFLLSFFVHLAYGWNSMIWMERIGPTGRLIILYVIVVVKCVDVGSYFTGRAIGRHKMFSRISPGKTWEGLAGGMTTGLLASWLFYLAVDGKFGSLAFTRIDAIVLGLLLPAIGVIGDLFESLLKRSAGAKDSGTVIPGMGGLLDVLDSLLFGVPVMYVYARLFM